MALGSASRGRVKLESRVVKVVAALDRARRSEVVERSFQGFARDLGFSGFICATLPASRALDAGDILMSTLPPDWAGVYLSRNFVRVDPVVRELLRGRRAFVWSDALAGGPLSAAEAEVADHAARYGLVDGFIVPIRESGGATGFVSLAGASVELDVRGRSAVTVASVYLYHKLCALRPAGADADRRLSPREVEILHWTAKGKSDWQIGRILEISAKTVNYHIENAKRKLGVATRVQAVVSAIQQGELRR